MNRRGQSGQVVVEYVLLMIIAISFGYLLMSKLVSRSTDNPGIITAKWHNLLDTIAGDLPDQKKKK